MAQIDLTKYGITGTTEIVYNPSYEQLFEAEMDPTLEGFEKGQVTELGAVNVMTGIYTGRSLCKNYRRSWPSRSFLAGVRISRMPAISTITISGPI